MPKNALSQISGPPDSRPTDAIVRRRIVEIAEVCGKELTKPLIGIWCQDLADIAPELLDRALLEMRKTCSGFFPTPGDVRKLIQRADATGLKFKSEKAWEYALEYKNRFYHPDLGVFRHAPELQPVVAHAIAAAGGLRWVECCPESELQWVRKRFLEAYVNFEEFRQAENLLSDGEAKKLLGELIQRMKGPRALPAVTNSPAHSRIGGGEQRSGEQMVTRK